MDVAIPQVEHCKSKRYSAYSTVNTVKLLPSSTDNSTVLAIACPVNICRQNKTSADVQNCILSEGLVTYLCMHLLIAYMLLA